ncbi:hypothetical protein LCGC14_1581430 [marine sediment metagenome]|uniref:ERF family protein n=1 Tax=marine sediment metagenome TaxID=412755 RepID=A0A0F9J2V4_9ZZZZ
MTKEIDKEDPRNWEKPPGIIYQQLANVMKDVKAIEKAQQSGGVNFKFRGIDDIYNSLHDIMAKHEVFCAPGITNSVRGSYQTSKGTTMQQVTTTATYRYYATDGSYVDTEGIGEGADVSDKATSKSLAMAHKYNLVQMFLIKTDDKDDVEAHDIEGEGTKTIAEVTADINKCTSIKHLQNIYAKYADVFKGEDLTTLIRAKDVKKGELQ